MTESANSTMKTGFRIPKKPKESPTGQKEKVDEKETVAEKPFLPKGPTVHVLSTEEGPNGEKMGVPREVRSPNYVHIPSKVVVPSPASRLRFDRGPVRPQPKKPWVQKRQSSDGESSGGSRTRRVDTSAANNARGSSDQAADSKKAAMSSRAGRIGELHGLAGPSQRDFPIKKWANTGRLSCGSALIQQKDLDSLRREVEDEQARYTAIGAGQEITVYTDGGCFLKGGNRKQSIAAIGVFNRPGSPVNCSKTVSLTHRQTNNVAEIMAAVEAVIRVRKFTTYSRICIVTDSNLLLQGWNRVPYWQANDWKTAAGKTVRNKFQFQALERAVSQIPGGVLRMVFVKGHADNEGNNAAHNLATAALHKKQDEVNQQAWARDPSSRPTVFKQSRFGLESKRKVNIPKNPTPAEVRKDIIAAADLARSINERMLQRPDLAQQAAELARGFRNQVEALTSQGDLRNTIIFKRKAKSQAQDEPVAKVTLMEGAGDAQIPRQPTTSVQGPGSGAGEPSTSQQSASTGPTEAGQPKASLSCSHCSSCSSGSAPPPAKKKNNKNKNRQKNKKKRQEKYEKLQEQLEFAMETAKTSDDPLVKALKQRIYDEDYKKEGRHIKTMRRNFNRKIRKTLQRAAAQKEAQPEAQEEEAPGTPPIPDANPPRAPDCITPPDSPVQPGSDMDETAALENLHISGLDSGEDVRSDSPDSVDLLIGEE